MSKILGLLEKYWPMYLEGLWGTIWLSAVTVVAGTLLGMFIALMRMSKSKILNGISTATYDPKTDPNLAFNYGQNNFRSMKKKNKALTEGQYKAIIQTMKEGFCG